MNIKWLTLFSVLLSPPLCFPLIFLINEKEKKEEEKSSKQSFCQRFVIVARRDIKCSPGVIN